MTLIATEKERKHVKRRTLFQQRRDASCHKVYIFLQGKALKEFHAIPKETLGEHAPSYATLKNWVTQIQELILENRRISSKSIAEQLRISRERVGFIIHEDLDMRKLSA
jgi:predicted HTH transcriptional regulator